MTRPNDSIPEGLCHCGCGRKTNISPDTCQRRGLIKGKPKRFLKGHHTRKSSVDFVVEDRGYKTPCHIWKLTKDTSGYGRSRDPIDQREKPVHVLAYEKVYGPVPDGLELDHLCRVRECRNPEHLEPVTHAENSRRGLRAKLTPMDIKKIRDLSGQMTHKAIGALFGISRGHASKIIRGEQWRDLE